MRGKSLVLVLALAMTAAACGNTAGPERRSLLGRWESENLTGISIEMALSETARAVSGAGRWAQGDSVTAFSITGSNTGESVSILLDFEDRPDVNFLGEFISDDAMEGTLAGGGLRAQPVTFVKVDD